MDGLDGQTARKELTRAIEQLQLAQQLLDEVKTIGFWFRSDDSSDNRRKRVALREADWAVSDAQRCIGRIAPRGDSVRPPISALHEELRHLVSVLEPLPDLVTDWMAVNPPALDAHIHESLRKLEDLQARLEKLNGALGRES